MFNDLTSHIYDTLVLKFVTFQADLNIMIVPSMFYAFIQSDGFSYTSRFDRYFICTTSRRFSVIQQEEEEA